ncbi:hypothetical protein A3Q56_04024 [Intoshia linei]|uniref:Uncharacterized protein n=1 Tax=Intoshia linei TaxID=1819745 RepID=A0A177B491_9BILA|nr:hypothetical protein A3Q56_04024 [Intoshia linei]
MAFSKNELSDSRTNYQYTLKILTETQEKLLLEKSRNCAAKKGQMMVQSLDLSKGWSKHSCFVNCYDTQKKSVSSLKLKTENQRNKYIIKELKQQLESRKNDEREKININ